MYESVMWDMKYVSGPVIGYCLEGLEDSTLMLDGCWWGVGHGFRRF